MKILAAIVIYNPDWSLLGDNIRAFYDHVDHILVWNNSDARIRLSDIRGLQPFFQKTTYKTLHKNVGIAQALNYAWHYAKEHGYDTLLTMDDDSVFEDYGTYRQRVEQHWQANGLSLCGPAAQPTKERGMQKATGTAREGRRILRTVSRRRHRHRTVCQPCTTKHLCLARQRQSAPTALRHTGNKTMGTRHAAQPKLQSAKTARHILQSHHHTPKAPLSATSRVAYRKTVLHRICLQRRAAGGKQ